MKAQSLARSCGVLVVDDDAPLAGTLREMLEADGYPVEVALSAAEALETVERQPHLRLALVDLMMPLTDGLTLMQQLHLRRPDLAILIMTGYGTIETAVDAIKRGAEDYITKPFEFEAARKKIARLMEVFELRERVEQLEADLQSCTCFESIVYVSPAMQRVIDRARAAAATDAPVLIIGETGTGKEMLGRAVHAASGRARAPFIPLNCGALPRDLVESELFGFRRGAFTGAATDTQGIFAAAAGGTVFLDEIGEMPKEIQVKLLRVLQEGEVRPVGSTRAERVDFRILSATNRPLAELRANLLREDLYFRIGTVVIEIPPLRSRPEDILVLAQHIAARCSRRYGRQIAFSRAATELLLRYSFPGNVRELENILESTIALSSDDPQTITDRELRPLVERTVMPPAAAGEQAVSMDGVERLAIERALRIAHGNRTKAASLLGISRDTLYRKLRQFGDGAMRR